MIYNGKKVKTAVALGFFDGLHTAHMTVLKNAAAEKCDGIVPFVLLFDEHPQQVVNSTSVPMLLQPEKRDRILSEIGLEIVTETFSEIKDMSPEEFFEEILIKELNAVCVCCGYNYRFGKNGSGDVNTLKRLCEKNSVKLIISERVDLGGEAVSSTRIRELIETGRVDEANRLLGRSLSFSAEVFSGDHRGRLLGAPTINQYLPEGFVVPKFGVYLAYVMLDGEKRWGVANIGSRPTFGDGSVRSETYIFDFSGDLYGKNIETGIVEFIRPEMKFSSKDELISQIKKDEKKAKKISKKY